MKKTLILDAGHGGSDSGALGSKSKEKDINLSIVKLIRDELKNDVNVFLTREADVYRSLSDRAKFSNMKNADLFISIHCNSFEDKKSNGFESFIYTNTDQKTKHYQKIIHEEYVKNIKIRDRSMKTAQFSVLSSTQSSAILLELAFISNIDEEQFLIDEKEKIAKAISQGIRKALNIKEHSSEKEKHSLNVKKLKKHGILNDEELWTRLENIKTSHIEALIANIAKKLEQ